MIEKTFPSVPISLQTGLAELRIAERPDSIGPCPGLVGVVARHGCYWSVASPSLLGQSQGLMD